MKEPTRLFERRRYFGDRGRRLVKAGEAWCRIVDYNRTTGEVTILIDEPQHSRPWPYRGRAWPGPGQSRYPRREF